ncbi:MAG: 4Fe-4S binding protein [Nitrospiraceae bacterium]|nr:MAG: 4Fe-4S binding protein [Nitrospiraceae bacterium]
MTPLIAEISSVRHNNFVDSGHIHRLRRTTQLLFILLIILAPVFDILRFDSGTRSLIVFGHVWSLGLNEGFYLNPSLESASHVAWRFFLKAVLPWLTVLTVFPLLGVFTGRFFCGWFCPEGAMFELFDFLTLKIFGRRSLFSKKANDPAAPSKHRLPYVILALFSMIAVPLFAGVVLTGYFVDPRTVWSQVLNAEFTFGVKAGITGVAIYIFISAMIVRHTLCKYVCGAGLMQMLFGWASPHSIRIRTDVEKLAACTDCKQCEKVCFMNVKPRLLRKDINCVNCGECIAACAKELGEGKGVFSFSQSRRCGLPVNNHRDTEAQRQTGRPAKDFCPTPLRKSEESEMKS